MAKKIIGVTVGTTLNPKKIVPAVDTSLRESGKPADAKATGEAIQELWDEIRYSPIEISYFTNNVLTVELGRTVNDMSLAFGTNKAPESATIDGEEVDMSGATECVLSLVNQGITETKKWTLEVTDERGATDTAETAVTFLNGVYYGSLAYGSTIDSAAVLSLTKKLQSGKALSFTVSPDGTRPVYALPTRYGTPTFEIGGLEYEWEKVATFDFTNYYGYTESYDVWMHGQNVTGSITVNVT